MDSTLTQPAITPARSRMAYPLDCVLAYLSQPVDRIALGLHPLRGARLARHASTATTPEVCMPAAAHRTVHRPTIDEETLAIKRYAQLNIAQVCGRLDGLSLRELQQLRQFEVQHGNRKGMLRALDRRIALTALQP